MEFSQKIRTRVERELGSEYQVQLREVHKNNGVVLHGLIIMAKSGNVTPTIYLESFHQAYEKGHTLGEVLRQIFIERNHQRRISIWVFSGILTG